MAKRQDRKRRRLVSARNHYDATSPTDLGGNGGGWDGPASDSTGGAVIGIGTSPDVSLSRGTTLPADVERFEGSTLTRNLTQNIIEVTEDRLRLVLTNNKELTEASSRWHTPLGILIAIVTTLVVSDFTEPSLGVPATTWQAVYIIAGVLAFAWTLRAGYRTLRDGRLSTIDQIVDELAQPGRNSSK